MRIQKMFRYIGLNGEITSAIELNCENKIEFYTLTADPGKCLTNGYSKVTTLNVFPDDIANWREIELEANKN